MSIVGIQNNIITTVAEFYRPYIQKINIIKFDSILLYALSFATVGI